MARLPIVVTIVAAFGVSIGCGASTSSQERAEGTPVARHPSMVADAGSHEDSPLVAVPDNPADRAIRRGLNIAIARDPDLRQRRISFIVANGDVSVNGTVGSEEERSRINELAMNVPGVKSIANALLIAE